MLRAANACAGVVQPSGRSFGLLHQLLDGGDARVGRGQKNQRHLGNQRDTHQVFAGVEAELFVQRLVHSHGAARDQQRVAIGGRANHEVAADVAAGTGFVLNDHRLAQALAQLIGQCTGKDVGGLPGRKRHHQFDGFVWPGSISGCG